MKSIFRRIMRILVTTMLMSFWSSSAWSFSCMSASGQTIPIGGGTASVYVDLSPEVNVGQNLVVDLSTQIFCRNDWPNTMIDYLALREGSAYGGVLQNFTGTVRYDGSSYPFPTNTETGRLMNRSKEYQPWPTLLYLTPISTASGVTITRGSLVARLILRQTNNIDADDFNFIWNIYANNDVVVPTGGCDVSSRNVNVLLPEYPGTAGIPLSIYCAQNQQISYYLSGSTTDSANAIFTNVAATPKADGIGIQVLHNGSILPANQLVSLGTVGTTPVSLGLTTTYALTSGQVTAGKVQSVIGVTFVYL